MNVKMTDISREVFGKYQFCSEGPDGLMYSDEDFSLGGGCGRLKNGAIPAPGQKSSAPYRTFFGRLALLLLNKKP